MTIDWTNKTVEKGIRKREKNKIDLKLKKGRVTRFVVYYMALSASQII
jgi:hypothetical protein